MVTTWWSFGCRAAIQTSLHSPLRRVYSSTEFRYPCDVIFKDSDHVVNPVVDKRLSRRRYSAANTNGRSKHINSIIASLKSIPKAEASASFEKLHPRDRLDVLRLLARRRSRNCNRGGNALPVYRSHLFERQYFFREEDLIEQSTLGRGPGGQATNRRMQTVILKHTPTGIVVKFSKFTSYWINRRTAREILNLRLEEHLLGPMSTLGRIKQRREKRRLLQLRRARLLAEKGSVISAKMSQQHEFYKVLRSVLPFPPAVLLQLGSGYVDRTLFMSHLFDEECSRWWPMLSVAFSHLNGNDNNDTNNDLHFNVPEFLRYVFPAVYFSLERKPTSVEKYEWGEVKKCAVDEACLRNVTRGLRCFVELFGLYLHERPSEEGSGGVFVLEPDGLNWLELRRRMVVSSERMNPMALACFSHLILSLTQLRCVREATAIEMFFRRESKAGVKGQWAVHGCKALQSVIKRHEAFEAQLETQNPLDT